MALLLSASLVLAQGNTAALDGTVTDPQGATISGAQVVVTNVSTGAAFKATSDERGHWVIPAMGSGVYRVTVTKQGFSAKTMQNVAMNAGVPATVNVDLELGQVTQTVEVNAGAEILQTTNATVTNVIPSRQVAELPFATRNSVELLVSQPGVSTPTNPRSSTVNGLPRGALNITIDGMNSQDNCLKSSDGFFSYIYVSLDAIEEISLTTSAAGVDSTGQGASQTRFVTKSGSNAWHGGVFEQLRNDWFNANNFFNNQNRLPRDKIRFNQYGGHFGGPILKNKLFTFTNYEIYSLPGTKAYTRQILTSDAMTGNYTYKDSTGAVRTVNVLQMAAKGGFVSTVDPTMLKTVQDQAKFAAAGVVTPRVVSNNDYNRLDVDYAATGKQKRSFFTQRFDYNITEKQQLSFVYNFDKYDSTPDFLNNIVDAFPGSGVVMGTGIQTGQRSNRFMGTLSLRSTLTPRLTSEFRAGLNGGTVLFFDALGSSSVFSQWKSYRPVLPLVSNVYTTTNSQRRNSPQKDLAETVTWMKGAHQLSLGGTFTQVNLFALMAATTSMPSVSIGWATGDPIYSGSTNLFTTTNMPNSASGDQTGARDLLALLTGRISSIGRSVALNENTKKYGQGPVIDRAMMREYGFFGQDAWRVRPSLTLTLGLRYERQSPFKNTNGVYTRPGIDAIWGASGVGNLFKPGTLPTASVPIQFNAIDAMGQGYKVPAVWAPSVGMAWQLPAQEGVLGKLFGTHQGASVLRVGYSVATIREGSNIVTSIWGSNKGKEFTATVNPTSYPDDFGPAGSVLFRDANWPSRWTCGVAGGTAAQQANCVPAAPAYPMAALFTDSLNEFNPNLKVGHVQSWNIGFQRELGQHTVMEVRYNGNRGGNQWRQYNINEVNIFENGFLTEFKAAQNNLNIARQTSASSNNFGNQKLAGQVDIPIIATAFGGNSSANDATFATQLLRGQAGSAASSLATTATYFNRLLAAGKPLNFFAANGAVGSGGAYVVNNDGYSWYDALQVELRRRMSAGLMMTGSYVWAKSMANGATSSSTSSSQPYTLRNIGMSKGPSGYDIRHAIKVNPIYELPFGPGRHFLSGGNPVVRKAMEGWQLAGVVRIQSSIPRSLYGGWGTMNANGSGVVLRNITERQIQDMITVTKLTGSDGKGIVYYLPADFINNTKSAFDVTGAALDAKYQAITGQTTGLTKLDPTKPYIGPAAPGETGWLGQSFRMPWQKFIDVSVVKHTKIRESMDLELRCQMLNVFNITNFNAFSGVGSSFGQITGAYADISGQVNPGSRVIEFVARFNF